MHVKAFCCKERERFFHLLLLMPLSSSLESSRHSAALTLAKNAVPSNFRLNDFTLAFNFAAKREKGCRREKCFRFPAEI